MSDRSPVLSESRERWNRRYEDAPGRFDPPEALLRLDRFVPRAGTAIDLAGGNGGAALHLAALGLRAVLVDISDVALGQARDEADARAVSPSRLITIERDLTGAELGAVLAAIERAGRQGWMEPPVSLICCFHFLERALLASVSRDLPTGAVFMAAIATTTNLERNTRPSARFLLEPGELAELVSGGSTDGPGRGLTVLHGHEGWTASGRHEAEIVVVRSDP